MKYILLFFTAFSFNSNAAFYRYSDLQLKDLSEMQKEINARVSKSRAFAEEASRDESRDESLTQEAIEALKDALQLLLSRPDQDNMVEKLMPLAQKPLNDFHSFMDTLHLFTKEALQGLSQEKLDVVHRTTYYVILENIMSQLAPHVKKDPEVKSIFIKIREAKVEVPEDIVNHRRMNSMRTTESPSETATRILERELPEEFKKEKRRRWWWFW